MVMTRLYVNVTSDRRGKAQGTAINQNGFVTFLWRARRPVELAVFRVNWGKGSDAPTLTLQGFDKTASFKGFDRIE